MLVILIDKEKKTSNLLKIIMITLLDLLMDLWKTIYAEFNLQVEMLK